MDLRDKIGESMWSYVDNSMMKSTWELIYKSTWNSTAEKVRNTVREFVFTPVGMNLIRESVNNRIKIY